MDFNDLDDHVDNFHPRQCTYHLGVDWGAMGLRVAVTRPIDDDPTSLSMDCQHFSPPGLFHHKDDIWLPLVGISLPGGTSIIGPKSYKTVLQDGNSDDVELHPNYVDWLVRDPDSAKEAERQAIGWLRDITQTHLTVEDTTTICLTLPLNGINTSTDPLHCAGFDTVFSCFAAEAALIAHHFAGRVVFSKEMQSWAVIDIGARETRCAIVGCTEGARPHQIKFQSLQYGGCMLDEAVAGYVRQKELSEMPDSPYMRFLLEQQLRDAKERSLGRAEGVLPAVNFVLQLPESQYVPISISADEFNRLCNPILIHWAAEVSQALRDMMTGAEPLSGVVLTGGTACLPMVKNVFQDALLGLSSQENFLCHEADRNVAFGLALAQANYLVQPPAVTLIDVAAAPARAQTGNTLSQPFIPQEPAEPPDSQRLRYRAEARKMLPLFVGLGAAIALALSPIPGASSPVLVFIEAIMLYNITRSYRLKITSGTLVWGVMALLVMSFFIKLIVVELLTFIPVLGWLIKPVTAALVIWGLGEISIAFFEKQRYGQGA